MAAAAAGLKVSFLDNFFLLKNVYFSSDLFRKRQ